jgi:3-oxoadipyl-CoA thiolase
MTEAFVCDGIRTPIGRYGGALALVRTDDLATIPIKWLMERYPNCDWAALDELALGCANQAGEDNRNIARMAVLLSGLPVEVPAFTVNRLCASGMEAVGHAARQIKCGEAELVVAGGVESMTRSPFVMPKASSPFDRKAEIYDSTIGWRFVNKAIQAKFGIDSMAETAENLAREKGISRGDQDAYAIRSQHRACAAKERLAEEICQVAIPGRKGEATLVTEDEHPRPDADLAGLAKLRPITTEDGTITAGNASGINDGACALIIASEAAAAKHGLTPKARIVGMASAGVEPRVMGLGPVPATKKLLGKLKLELNDIDIIELNEAFAAQVLTDLREFGIADDAAHVNPNGGAIALGHPLGMSGARLVLTATRELERSKAKRALCTLCVGVGQGVAMVLERV